MDDALQLLFSASKSGELEEALDILIETSKISEGRADLASRNILPFVLQLIQSLPFPSSRQRLLLSLKLVRNLCAGEAANQDSFTVLDGAEVVSTVLSSAVVGSDPDGGIIRMGLQVLANVCLAGEQHQRAIWGEFFPVQFAAIAAIRSRESCDPLCMILYTCCDGCPSLIAELCGDGGLSIVAEIVRTVSSVGFGEDWVKLLLSRICLEDIHFPQLFAKLNRVGDSGNSEGFRNDEAFLLSIVSEILTERISDIIVPNDFAFRVLEIFRRSIEGVDFATRGKSGLPTGCAVIDVLGYSLTILRDICARDARNGHEEDGEDVVDRLLLAGLLDLLLDLLHSLEPPTTIRKAMQLRENGGALSSDSNKPCPYVGFRRDIVAVIGNCAYRRKHVQDELRQKHVILLLLQQCVIDEHNPYLREWGIWSMRNLLEGNAENQQAVAELELQGSDDMPELRGLGLRVEVDQKTGRAKLVNIS